MTDRYRLTTVEQVREAGSWLFTVRDEYDTREEAILVPCADSAEASATTSQSAVDDNVDHSSTSSQPAADDGVEAWINRCTHQPQRLDTGRGATIRDGEIVCPRHGSAFDACSGVCDNGEAAGTQLRPIEVTVDDGVVYLTDDDVQYLYDGGLSGDEGETGDDDAGGGPSSTSHISF